MKIGNLARLSLSATFIIGAMTVTARPVDGQSVGSRLSSGDSAPRQGQRIRARDGDVILLDDDARVRVIRRRDGFMRAVFNPSERTLILVIDRAARRGEAPDGRADESHHFREMTGDWPLGERWEGGVVIEEYSLAGQNRQGLGLRTAQGFVQILNGGDTKFEDPSAAIMSYRGGASGMTAGMSFDEAESRAVADLARSIAMNATVIQGSPGPTARSTLSRTDITASSYLKMTAGGEVPGGAVRVGGNVRAPQKIHDVAPILPAIAQQANVRGTVILELTVGTDGTVTNARVLRSIPLLDAAALDAVRQWRYEPVLLNGAPVPVIMTATVTF